MIFRFDLHTLLVKNGGFVTSRSVMQKQCCNLYTFWSLSLGRFSFTPSPAHCKNNVFPLPCCIRFWCLCLFDVYRLSFFTICFVLSMRSVPLLISFCETVSSMLQKYSTLFNFIFVVLSGLISDIGRLCAGTWDVCFTEFVSLISTGANIAIGDSVMLCCTPPFSAAEYMLQHAARLNACWCAVTSFMQTLLH